MARRRDIPHSQNRIKRKRKIILWKFLAILFAVIFVVGGAAWGLSRPALRIARVEVTGNSVLETDEIVSLIREEISGKYFFLFPKDSIMLYPKERIENGLRDSFKRILSIKLTAQGLTALSVTIEERKPFSLWCGETLPQVNIKGDAPCYFTDETGFIFAEAPRFGDNVYVALYGPIYETALSTSSPNAIPIGSMFLPISEFKIINSFRDLLGRIGLGVNTIAAMDAGDFTLILREGGKILVNKKQDPMGLVSDIESAFRAELGDPGDPNARKRVEYIDARFANKIFFKKRSFN